MTENPVVVAANSQLRGIWVDQLRADGWPQALGEPLWPLQYPSMESGRMLFVGLNPSYRERDYSLLRVRQPFATDLHDPDRVAEIVGHEERALRGTPRHPYYEKFDPIAGDSRWNHVDVLTVRCTKQDDLKKALHLGEDGTFQSDFVRRQIEVTRRLIDALEPPVAVVANALAATILRKVLGHELTWDESTGFHRRSAGGHATPWFFSGMLTGQRALDIHSFERLQWHVRRALASSR